MTQTSTLQSLQITSLNASPPISYSTGEGAPGASKRVEGYVTALSADAIGSTYKLCRLPSNAKIKKITLNSAVASAGAGNIGLYYSNSTQDYTIPADQNTAASASLFAAAQSIVGTGQNVDVTFLNTYTFANVNTPIWNVMGLGVGAASNLDPGGMFDLQITLTTAVTTGGVVGVSVDYVE